MSWRLVFGVAGRGQARRSPHQEGRRFVAEADDAAVVVVLAAANRLDAAHRQRATDGTLRLGARGGSALGFDAGLLLARLAALGATITITAAFTTPFAARTVAFGAFSAFGTRRAFGFDLRLFGLDARLLAAFRAAVSIAATTAFTA